MGRREHELPADGNPVHEFAGMLRALRVQAGSPPYRRLAADTHFSPATLARAAAGNALPTLEVTLAYVAACGADTAGWEQRWREIKRALATPAPPRERPPALENLVAPMQLPPAVAAMFGRDGTLRTLDALAEQPREPGAPLIVAITGPAGVGKTALAVRWAHRVAARFADGVLMADLRGYAPGGNPVEAGEQLETFLRAMGVPATSIPAGTEARSALLRSVLGNRRVLIVLDNARSVDQVRELLPASEHCAVVITSRAALPGLVSLYGAVTIRLGHLAESDARALLLSRLGPEHAMAEPELLARVSGLCAGLPLALCILADRAATEPSLGLVGLAEAMGDARGRLRGLAGEEGHSSLPALLSWTYRSLPTGAARMFRRLALHPGGEIGIHAAAALAGTTPAEARRDVLVLLDVHLLEQSSHERFRFHDLVNLFAAECAERDESPSSMPRRCAVDSPGTCTLPTPPAGTWFPAAATYSWTNPTPTARR